MVTADATRRYRRLDASKIVSTAEKLTLRISERFPNSGLHEVSQGLLSVATDHAERVRKIRRPDPLIRGGIILFGVTTTALGLYGVKELASGRLAWSVADGLELIQVAEATLGILVFSGAAIAFLFNLEARVKRRRALHAIHELRSLAHIVDMHQLTKDPERARGKGEDTTSSPKRELTPFLLGRYLDYCSEALALIAKIGALYAQDMDDAQAISAVDEIEDLTTGLSRKIWQKIVLLGQDSAF